jgi:hypothetical protein
MKISIKSFFFSAYGTSILERSSRLYSQENQMSLSLGVKSLLSFVLSVMFLIFLTLSESLLTGLSVTAERAVSFLLLVMPGIIGVVFGILGIVRKETKAWIAYLGILLNTLFGLFHLLVLSFAG